jgi:DNA invertase Pin-like site-specific DNA recombinase
MLTAELGIILLKSRGVSLLTAAGEDLTNTDDEMRVAFRQIAMAFAQLEKTRLVKKLRGARDRKSEQQGKRIEGRPSHAVKMPEAVALARSLAGTMTLRAISDCLAEHGHVNSSGKAFDPNQIKRMIG